MSHLRMLEAESIHIIREVAAEFAPGDALLHRVGLLRDAAPGAESVPSRKAAVSTAALRHNLQVTRIPDHGSTAARSRPSFVIAMHLH